MDNMAIGTGNFIVIMWAAVPPETNVIAVTIEAHVVLHQNIRFFVRSKFDDWWPFLSASDSRGVLTARSMTGLALQLSVAKRATRISRNTVFGFEDRQCLIVAVAGDTGIGPLPAVRYVVRSLSSGLRLTNRGRQNANSDQDDMSSKGLQVHSNTIPCCQLNWNVSILCISFTSAVLPGP